MRDYRLFDLLDMSLVQKLAYSNFRACGLPMSIIDAMDGSILVQAGWQDVCTKFHRAYPVSAERCRESDISLTGNLIEGEFYRYKCNNGLWYFATPIIVAGKHLATLFLTQFFFENETPDREYFLRQACEFGYDAESYLAAVDRIPLYSTEKIHFILDYDMALVRFITDLAERSLRVTETQKSLSTSEEKYRALVDNVNIGICRTTANPGTFIQANPAMVRMFGYDSVEEFLNVPLHELYRSPEDRVNLVKEVRRNGFVKDREFVMTRKDGTAIWCSTTATAVFGETGEMIWLDGVIEDVTERKKLQEQQRRALDELTLQVRQRIAELEGANGLLHSEIAVRKRVEEKLREQYQFLEVLINTIPSPIFYKDAKGIYRGCNRAFEQYLGREGEEIIGKTDYDLATAAEADKYLEMDRALFEKPGIQDYEASVKDADGVRHDLIIVKAPYYKTEGTIGGVIGIMVDVTDRRKYEEERLKMDKLESLGVLAGGIAHDFNNIITGILGNISLARMYLDTPHKSIKPLEAAEKASQRAAELAHQLLTFAKGGDPIKKTIKLQYILKECISFVLRGSNVQGLIDITDSLHAVEADEGQISQAFGNMILNGVQAMPGGGTLRIHGENITMGTRNKFALPPGKYVKIDFIDKGCGIAVENRKKIFDPYFTTKAKGTGLGLSSAYSIIVRHGGYIDVNSVVGSGTTFTCYLPSTGETKADELAEKETMDVDATRGGTVLVMDDEEMIREIAAEILDYLGYKATTCARGEEAVALYKAAMDSGAPFAAAIMDLTIPGGMGGKEAAEQILGMDPDARLIVSSGYSVDPVMAQYAKYGFCGAVGKPYEAKEIAQVLGAVMK
ncbi:MAG TPA: PocR ligand-binding domain-containing protein [Geobacteraceae bacterium]|nr:PocR ligand-binding domain-containing protein [Geobacteraceae bacterium]